MASKVWLRIGEPMKIIEQSARAATWRVRLRFLLWCRCEPIVPSSTGFPWRPVWCELERRAPSFTREELRPFRFLDVSVLVSSGTKGEAVV